MRFDKRSRKIRTKKKKTPARTASFLGYLAFGLVLLGFFYFLLYQGHEKQLRRIRQEKIQEDFDRICGALILYFQDHRAYPTNDQGLDVLVRKGDESSGGGESPVTAGNLERAPLDPWGNPYAYRASARADDLTLICWGADGVPGGSGEAADVIRKGCRSTTLPLH